MSTFGWAYVSSTSLPSGVTGAVGPTGSLQFHSASQEISGSPNLIFDPATNKLTLLGQLTGSSLVISASAISASSYVGITAGGTPGGSDKQIQFNSGSAFSGSQNLTYDYSTGKMTLTGSMYVSGNLYANEYHTTIVSASIIYSSGSTKFGDDASDEHQFTGSIYGGAVSGTTAQFTALTGSTVTGSTGLFNTITSSFITSSAISASTISASTYLGLASIGYVEGVSTTSSLSQIEVADFSGDVAVTFVGGKLKFIFGTPTSPSGLNVSLNGFLTDRFNKVFDAYSITGSWNNGAYTLVSASLYTGSTLLAQVGAGTSLTYAEAGTTGSQVYRLEYTASSPLDGSYYTVTGTVNGTLLKTLPANPVITPTTNVQLGTTSNQIEQGATGSISFTSSSADPSNAWQRVSLTTNTASPITLIGALTGSTPIVISATASYNSPAGQNDPDPINQLTYNSITYTKIRSLRYGASTSGSFTESELADITSWDIGTGGTIGYINKGTTNPNGQSVTITWSDNKYLYIIYDSARLDLTGITSTSFPVLSDFTSSSVGQYKVYRTIAQKAGGAGNSITYTLSTT
jgi:hypothetical protein